MMLRTTISCGLIFVAGSAVSQSAGRKVALSPAEQTAAVNAVRTYVLGYVRSLPNHTASVTVHHTTAPVNAVNDPSIQSGAVEEHLSFIEGKETVDQAPGMLPHDFGNLPGMIVDPASGADLRWEHTATIDHRRVDVLAFHVPVSAGYFLSGKRGSIQVPFEGFVYADAETHAVLRVQMKCTMIPDDFSIRTFGVTLDYKAEQMNGREFILPSRFLLQAVDSAQDRRVTDDGRYSDWSPLAK